MNHTGLRRSLSSIAWCLAAVSGAAWAEPGVTAQSIIIGQSAGFTGTAGDEVKQATAGAKIYFDQVNKQGGIFGRKIMLESLDDGFEPKRTVENTKKLLNEKNAFVLFLFRGTPTTEAILPMITEAKVPLIAPVTGATSLHQPMHRYVFNVRPKYRDEVHKAVQQLSTMGMQRIAVLTSNDSFGNDALEGLKEAIKKQNLPEPTIASYERNTVKVEAAVQKIYAAKPQAVLMFCTSKPCAAFIKEYRAAGGFQPLFTLSNVSSQAFIRGLEGNGRGLGMTQAFPNPKDTTIPIAKEFHAVASAQKELQDSYPAFEGYVSAKVLVEGLRKSGAQPTREGFVSAMESLKGADMGGIRLGYSPTSRDGSDFIELTVVGRNGTIIR